MVRLKVLGGAVLERDGVPVTGPPAQRHNLALLALLAAAPARSATRDKLIASLWPECDMSRARHRLSVALHVLRRELGKDCLTLPADAVALHPEVMWTDVDAFRSAVAEGRLEEAVGLYAGPFLDGFFLGGAPDFDEWVEAERRRLADIYRASLRRLIEEAEETCDAARAAEWWRRLATHDPHSAPVTVGLVRALIAMGDVAGALFQARAHVALVEGELGLPADPEVIELADELVRAAPKRSHEMPSQPAVERTAQAHVVEAAPETWALPDGRSETFSPTRQPRPPQVGLRRKWLILLALLAATVGLSLLVTVAVGPRLTGAGGAGARDPSVAVIHSVPTEDASALPPLVQGLADQLSATLALVPGLYVALPLPATPGAGGDLRQAGQELGVASLVDVGVRKEEDHAVVTASLVDVRTGESSWSAMYRRPASDPAGLQEEVSLAIADAVRPRIVAYRPKSYTDNERAYDRFLEGVFAHRRFTQEDVWTALQFYREAYEEDPGFALAHAIAGNAYIALSILGTAPQTSLARAREHVTRALTLDSTLAEGYAALGYLQIFGDHDFAAGERSLRRAIMLYPTLPQARDWYGRYALYVRGWPDVGLASARLALEVDPLNTARSHLIEWMLYFAHRYDEVSKQSRVTWSLDPDVAGSLPGSPLAEAYRELGRYDEAIAEFHGMMERTGDPPPSGLAVTYARIGRTADARAILRELEHRAEGGRGSPVAVARVHANLGESDRALTWLKRGFEGHQRELVTLRVDPTFDPLRSDPRFLALLRRIGLHAEPASPDTTPTLPDAL